MQFGLSRSFAARALAALALLCSCGRAPAPQQTATRPADHYKVLCTVGMITDVVRNLAGDTAAVEGLIGEGSQSVSAQQASLANIGT